MNYVSAVILMEIVGFLSIFFITVIAQAFKSNDEMKDFIEKNLENGVSAKVLIISFAIMGIILTYYKFMNVKW